MNGLMLAAQVPMIEGRAAQALFQRLLQPVNAEPESWGKIRQAFAPKASIENGIGVLEITGVLAYRPDIGSLLFDGFEDSGEVLSAFRRLEADPEAQAIVLNVNSPGGFSVGTPEIADAVFKSSKPTVAWAGGMMCSLAYWIGSQPGRVLLHLVNLTSAGTWRQPVHELIPVGPLQVRVKLPADVRGKRARLLVAGRTVTAHTSAGGSRFIVRTILDHEVIVIEQSEFARIRSSPSALVSRKNRSFVRR